MTLIQGSGFDGVFFYITKGHVDTLASEPGVLKVNSSHLIDLIKQFSKSVIEPLGVGMVLLQNYKKAIVKGKRVDGFLFAWNDLYVEDNEVFFEHYGSRTKYFAVIDHSIYEPQYFGSRRRKREITSSKLERIVADAITKISHTFANKNSMEGLDISCEIKDPSKTYEDGPVAKLNDFQHAVVVNFEYERWLPEVRSEYV